jgi:hypothetical protein
MTADYDLPNVSAVTRWTGSSLGAGPFRARGGE